MVMGFFFFCFAYVKEGKTTQRTRRLLLKLPVVLSELTTELGVLDVDGGRLGCDFDHDHCGGGGGGGGVGVGGGGYREKGE
jgi:hypothetical protein